MSSNFEIRIRGNRGTPLCTPAGSQKRFLVSLLTIRSYDVLLFESKKNVVR